MDGRMVVSAKGSNLPAEKCFYGIFCEQHKSKIINPENKRQQQSIKIELNIVSLNRDSS